MRSIGSPTKAGTPVGAPPTSMRRVLTGAMAGAVLEWYDFAIYGILAATVLGPLFFPDGDPTVALLAALATQGLGFVARPLGGIVFGHLGDKYGRKPMLVVTFVMLGVSTAAIGLLPTYAEIGAWATGMLVLLRMIQGFALGGEFGAAVLLVSEYGEPRRRGFWASWPQAGAPLGTVLATLVAAAAGGLFPGDAFGEWGWRVCFLVAVPLLAIGFWVRRGIEESPVFQAAQERAAHREQTAHRSSILEALRTPRPVLHGLGVRLGENIAFYVYTIFVVAYATQFEGFDRGTVLTLVTIGSLFQFAGMLFGGWWSDRVGRRRALIVPSVVLVAWAPVFFWLAGLHSTGLLLVGVSVGTWFHGMLAGPEAAWITELFPTRHRFAGSSLVFQGSSIIAGAPAPFIAVWLVSIGGTAAVIGYLVLTMAITVLAAATCPETAGRNFHETDNT
ncbi:MFS transporter [Streptomyces sp. NPDC059894]|uniref:MFS transporter n=1 Tax=unclassified Streptomyces TaxID=2593676 RepID=UPI0036598096